VEDDLQAAVRDHIFISYRRDDARGASGRLYDWLRIAFGRERVFRDVHSIGVGKWRDKIDDALTRSAVCVAVIGPRWANADNLARLHDESDMVRHELVNALTSPELTLVPTLVEGANVPNTADLPPALQPLLGWRALPVTEEGWEDDTRRLIADIEKAAKLSAKADLDTLLRDVGAAQQRVAELEHTRHLQADQIDGLRRTVEELTRKLAEAPAGERPGLAEAFAALARGDSLAAEDAFEREFDAQSRAADEARKTMAEAARNVANLALLRDVSKAVSFYRKALDSDPEHSETARLLGYALIVFGDLSGAEVAFSQSLKAAVAQGDVWGQMAAQAGLGDVLQRTGNLGAAKDAYMASLSLSEALVVRDPANTRWQRDLTVSYGRIGDMQAAQGDSAAALKSFHACLAVFEHLAASHPRNNQLQLDLSVGYERIGEVQAAQGNSAAALKSFRASLAIRERLATNDTRNSEWQRGLSVSYYKIGAVLAALGDSEAALTSFQAVLVISERLAASDPRNSRWQRGLSASYDRIGDVQATQGHSEAALTSFQTGLAISERLAASDPRNSEWQRDMSVSYEKIGNVQAVRGDSVAAFESFQASLAIRERLATSDPRNSVWQRDLSASYDRIGNVQVAQGDSAVALVAHAASIAFSAELWSHDFGKIERALSH
jgi:tetratricopeptide (TPR) repeat protein